MFEALGAIVLASQAADAPAENSQPGDIVVTGERIPRTLRETASSVAVVTADQIAEMAAADRIDEILAFIPNVQLGSGGEGPTIRGQDTTGAMRDLPAFLGGNRPRTTLIVDGRAVSFNEFVFGVAPLWDVERVEVFRTPQTTTQGRNSIAGAIFVYSNDPVFEWQGAARAIVGELRTRQLSGSLTGPILPDELAIRVSGDWRRKRPAADVKDNIRGADFEKDKFHSLRGKLLFEPKAIAGASVVLTYSHSESLAPAAVGLLKPYEERHNPNGGAGVFGTNVDSLTASVDYQPSSNFASRTILSRGDAKVQRFAPPGVGETMTHIDDWSAETVVDWKYQPALRLSGGASYMESSLDQRIDLSVLAGIGLFDDKQHSIGLFGEANWQVADRLQLTAGVRFQQDEQHRKGTLGEVPLDYHRTFDAWLPKLSISYEFNDDLLAGVLVQKAYNPGGATLRFDTGEPDEFEAERLWNYELFARASVGPGLDVRLNVFRAEIRDAQRFRPIRIIPPSGVVVTFADMFNVDKAHSQGAEFELNWRATRRLTARGAIGLLDTEIVDSGGAPDPIDSNEFQRSPHFSGSLALDWRPIDSVRLSTQLRHNSGFNTDDANTREIEGKTVVNARLSWEISRMTLFAYARNLFDKFYLTDIWSPTSATAGDPREVGVGIEASF